MKKTFLLLCFVLALASCEKYDGYDNTISIPPKCAAEYLHILDSLKIELADSAITEFHYKIASAQAYANFLKCSGIN